MIEIESLKKNWQNQKPASAIKYDFERITGDTLSRLKKFEKKQLRINLFKTIGIVLLFIYLIWAMLFATHVSMIKITAIVWLVLSTAIFLRIYWKVQFKVNKLNVKGNSLDFIDDVIRNFTEQKNLFREKFWIFGIALIIGINILYLDFFSGVQLIARLGLHALVTVILALTIWGGIKFRMLRFKREYEPIINDLTKIKNDLTEAK